MFIHDGNTKLHLWTQNETGPRVLFIHGWATSGFVWHPIFQHWKNENRLLAVDLLGTGFSHKPNAGYNLESHTESLISILDQMDDDVILVGHSMGGALAQLVALERPARLRGLILMSPVPASGVPMPEEERNFLRSLVGDPQGMTQVFGSMMAAGSCPDINALVASAAALHPQAYLEGLDAFCGANFAARLAELKTPTHVICGEKEAPLTPEVMKAAVVAPIPNATFEVMGGVAHYPQWESPENCTRVLENAVRRFI